MYNCRNTKYYSFYLIAHQRYKINPNKPTVISVAKPSGRDTPSGVVTPIFVLLAIPFFAAIVFVRPVLAILGAIARPRGRDTEAVVTRVLIRIARVAASRFVRIVTTI